MPTPWMSSRIPWPPSNPGASLKRAEKPAPQSGEKTPAPQKQQPRARKQRERKQSPREEQAAPSNAARDTLALTPLEHPEPDSPAGIAQQFLCELTALMGLEIKVSMALDADGHVFCNT